MTAPGPAPAALALACFQRGEYAACARHLACLPPALAADPRVEHNRALAELLASPCSPAACAAYSRALARLTGAPPPPHSMRPLPEPALRRPRAALDHALLLYHARHYSAALRLLERLHPLVVTPAAKADDRELSRRVVLLLMEVCLCRRAPDCTIDLARRHKDLIDGDTEAAALFERLACRARLMMTGGTDAPIDTSCIEGLFLEAHRRYLAGEPKEAIETLARYETMKINYDMRTQGEDIWAAINNDLGVAYLALKKPFLATKYFQNAVKEHLRAMESKDSDRLIVCRDRPIYVYNLGLAMLQANRPEGAFECLVEAARHFPNNPRIWLRLADCCVKYSCNETTQQSTIKKLGSGAHSRLMLCRGGTHKYSTSGESFAIPSLSLEFASLCLRNALTLLPNRDTPADLTRPFLQAPPGTPLNWKQRCQLKNAVLIQNSYVFLQLQDPLSALNNSTTLLKQPDISYKHKALGHIYAAEALINLDRISEAIEHLNPAMIHEIVSFLPHQIQDMMGVSVWEKAAVCHILRGDLVTARKILTQINSPRVLPLQVYLEMCTGNIENCHGILRKMKFQNTP